MDTQIGHHRYSMPRVTLLEAATEEELSALNMNYISYTAVGGRKKLLERQRRAMQHAACSMQQDRFVVELIMRSSSCTHQKR